MVLARHQEKKESGGNPDSVDHKPVDHPALLEVQNLSLSFRQYREGLRESTLQVISKLDVTIREGEIVAVVGASGSGKSLLANAVLGILPEHAVLQGTLKYKGEALTRRKQLKLQGTEIALIPQSVQALDPLMKSARQVQTVIKAKDKQAIQEDIFHKVGLPLEAGKRYPFELSGGMARRVLASTAMVSGAKLVIADEPTPGLDKHAVEETIHHLQQLAADGKGMMLITHDIEAALRVAHKIAVFYAGQTVEIADAQDFSGKGERLRHPYTQALWHALPQNDFIPLAGSQPLPGETCSGCVFEPRCPLATKRCKERQPEARSIAGGMVRCFHA